MACSFCSHTFLSEEKESESKLHIESESEGTNAEQIGGFDGRSRVVQVLPYPGTRGHPFLRGFFSSRKKGRGGLCLAILEG